MILSWAVGDRSAQTANLFMDDLAQRLASAANYGRPSVYLDAVTGAFGDESTTPCVNWRAKLTP